jgi:hypothetical protein
LFFCSSNSAVFAAMLAPYFSGLFCLQSDFGWLAGASWATIISDFPRICFVAQIAVTTRGVWGLFSVSLVA